MLVEPTALNSNNDHYYLTVGVTKRVEIPPFRALPIGQGSYSLAYAHPAGMHSLEQTQDTETTVEYEIFSALSMAGVQGRIKAVLSEEKLLLERRTGHTLQLKLSAMNRLRHHHSSLIPRWMLGFGLVLLYGAWRVFVGQPAIIMLIVGTFTVLAFILGRRPTLTIDTESGDCHTLFGNDASLMRMCYLVKRLQSGICLDDARKGLELLEREADYPSISPLEGIIGNGDPIHMQEPVALEVFLGNDEVSKPFDLLPEWAAKDSDSPLSIIEPTYTERVNEIDSGSNPNHMSQPAPFLRAESVRQDMRNQGHAQIQAPNPWQQPQLQQTNSSPQQQFGNYHNPYSEPVPQQSTNSNTDSMFGGFDMFAEGGLFDSPEPSQSNYDTPSYSREAQPQSSWAPSQPHKGNSMASTENNQINSFDLPNPTQSADGGFNSQRWQNPDTRPAPTQSSYQMIEQRAGNLPPANQGALHPDVANNNHQQPTGFIPSFLSPLEHGARQDNLMRFEPNDGNEQTLAEDNHLATGLVAGAKIDSENDILDAELAEVEEESLEQFPRLAKLTGQRNPSNRRIRLRHEAMGQSKPSTGIRGLILPSISRLGKLASSPSRLFRRKTNAGDGYAEVYGDGDGYRDGIYREERFHTSQALRLAADQSYQAQISDEIARLTKANGGVLPDSVADQLLRHIADTGEGQQRLLTAGPEEIPTSFSDLSSSSEVARKVNDIPGIARMDANN